MAQEGGWGEGRQSCDVVGTAVLGEGNGGGAEEVSWGLLSWGRDWGRGRRGVMGTAVLGEGTVGGAEEVGWGLLSRLECMDCKMGRRRLRGTLWSVTQSHREGRWRK